MKVIPLPVRGPDGKPLPPWVIYDPPAPYKVEPAKVMPLPTRPAAPAQSKVSKEGF